MSALGVPIDGLTKLTVTKVRSPRGALDARHGIGMKDAYLVSKSD